MKNNETSSGKHYLTGDYSRELNYKLWSTKGARFIASQRLSTLDKLSVVSVSFMSIYLIIFNIADRLIFSNCEGYKSDVFFILNIFMSIVILCLTLIISKEEYSKRSERHHQCGLEIGKLYKALRIAKTMGQDDTLKEAVEDIDERYQHVLEKYENHTPIDRYKFLANSRHYEDNKTTATETVAYRSFYILRVYVFHFLVIIIPPLCLAFSIYSAVWYD